MQVRWMPLAALILMMVPLNLRASEPAYLSAWDHMCKAALADGTKYEEWDRLLVTNWNGKDTYLPVRGFYKPHSGEFLLRASIGFVDKEHAIESAEKPKKGGSCIENPKDHLLLLRDGEWIDFRAMNGRIEVFHSRLKFHSRKEAWSYVATHWQDADPVLGGAGPKKFVEEIYLNQQLGSSFFRPKRLETSAQAYFYNSLGSVKKVGQNWELEIKGADEPNRATVLLDNDFKLLTVTKNPGTD